MLLPFSDICKKLGAKITFITLIIFFYGSYDYIGTARGWYRHEIRIIKNDKSIRSYKDAQGFRKNNKKLKVWLVDAYIHHYG